MKAGPYNTRLINQELKYVNQESEAGFNYNTVKKQVHFVILRNIMTLLL